MLAERWFYRLPLKARLIWSYLIILAIGGLATSLVGSWIVSSTIMMQARRAAARDFATARTVYEQRLEMVRMAVRLAAIDAANAAGLERIRREAGLDFLGLAGAGDPFAAAAVVQDALAGKVSAGTEILPGALLESGRDGMALIAAAPVGDRALFGGVLLNGNHLLVDRVREMVSSEERLPAGDESAITIFQKDTRISTSMRSPAGERALGTRADPEIVREVVGAGRVWKGRTRLMGAWHIGEYAPIRNPRGEIVGMMAAALPESSYTSIRNRVILSFFGIALLGFVVIIAITYTMIRSITRPIGEMVAATRNITAGRFDQEVKADSSGEIALLAESFNAMLKSLRQMKGDLEEWGRTLELKVKQRTEELVAMQARVAQSERLASLGMLAAGVAHEVNNPLGGILALTALTLEDMREDDPNRENLEEVIRQTERCRDIVRRLLEFSRQSKGDMEPADLNRVLAETLALMTRQAQFFNIKVAAEWEPRLPPVMADRSQMQQVFMNILGNAAQAMKERGTITIATRAREGMVEVSIADTGSGIPPELVDRIFDPFFTTKESGQGTGLGLSIAYGIVTTHGGTISVASEVGRGSTFTIRMPALAAGAAGTASA